MEGGGGLQGGGMITGPAISTAGPTGRWSVKQCAAFCAANRAGSGPLVPAGLH